MLQFHISMNEKNEIFVEKYLTTNQIFLPKDIRKSQIHQHKWTCKEKWQQICQFQYPKPSMWCTKILLSLNLKNCILNLWI